jgi:valyl-tRNA synthetase
MAGAYLNIVNVMYLDEPFFEGQPNCRRTEHFDLYVYCSKHEETAKAKFDVDQLKREHTKLTGMLNNPGFMAKAPGDVVSRTQTRVKEIENILSNHN